MNKGQDVCQPIPASPHPPILDQISESGQKQVKQLTKEQVREMTEAENAKQLEEHSPDEQIKPLFEWVGCSHLANVKPPEMKFIFKDVLPAGVVGAIFASGGTGKTFMGLQMAACIASGVSLEPFKPVGTKKVLYLCGEDPAPIVHQRIYSIFSHMPGLKEREALLIRNLQAESMVGQDRFLAQLGENGNPAETMVFKRLQKTIEKMKGLEVLVIDPLSRFYGLAENLNEHATFFVSILEALAMTHGLTILFAHHVAKGSSNNGGRGASALRDGIRFAINMNIITEEEATEGGVNQNDFVELAMTKNNYSKSLNNRAIFERSAGGVLIPASLFKRKLDNQADKLACLIGSASDSITRRGISKSKDSKNPRNEAEQGIIEEMKEQGVKSYQKEMPAIINKAISSGLIVERGNGFGKTVLSVKK